jgi:hypothetical protein
VLRRAMNANPAERFASCAEFSGALVAAMAQAASQPSDTERTALDISL